MNKIGGALAPIASPHWLWHCTRRVIIQHEALFPHFLYEFFQLTYLFFIINFLNLTLITMIVNSLTAAQFGLDKISDRVCSVPLLIDLHSVLNKVIAVKCIQRKSLISMLTLARSQKYS